MRNGSTAVKRGTGTVLRPLRDRSGSAKRVFRSDRVDSVTIAARATLVAAAAPSAAAATTAAFATFSAAAAAPSTTTAATASATTAVSTAPSTTAATAVSPSTTASATAAVSAATTTTTEAAFTGRTLLAGAGNVDGERPAAEFLAMEQVHGPLGFFGRGELNEGETARAARELVEHEVDVQNDSGSGEVVLQVILHRLVGQIAHEETILVVHNTKAASNTAWESAPGRTQIEGRKKT